MNEAIPKVLTPGEIAQRLGVPLHKVTYVLRARQIQPLAYAGTLRLFDQEGMTAIEGALAEIARKKHSRESAA